MSPLRIVAAFILFFAAGATLSAQELPAIAGRLVDSKTTAPVPFATIRLKSGYGLFGVVSNGNGDFQIPGRYRNAVDTIRISCIGYVTKVIFMDQLKDNEVNIVRLSESVTELSEVVVKGRKSSFSVYSIVKQAIDNIPKNYPTSFNSYIGYYRDYQMIDSTYKNLNEAIVGVYDSGFSSTDYGVTELNLFDYKKNETFGRDSLIAIAYDNNQGNKFIPGAELSSFGGNELMILRIHDPLRNSGMFSYSFVNQFNRDFLDNHLFKLEPIVYLDKVPLYDISFKAKYRVSGQQYSATGHLYIDQNTFAIHRFNYSVYRNVNWEFQLLYNVQLEYSKIDTLMRLNYISFNNFFEVKDPGNFEVKDVSWNLSAEAFVVEFNHAPEEVSAIDPKNYHFKLDGQKLEIDRVKLRVADKYEAFVYLKSPLPGEEMSKLLPRLKYEIHNIKDLDGKEVNKIYYIDVNQFREFFVHNMEAGPLRPGTLFMNKNTPLSKSPITSGGSQLGYWMNTPLKDNLQKDAVKDPN